ncbi:MAG TPA: dienelactone hydrolase family protein [Gemmatimonadales bacterium]|nr:dienelactone hydrolase family protein [Gemmatimonadales bacterium]
MAVLLLLSLAGAALGWWLGARGARETPAQVTTHGEWVRIARGTDSLRAYVAYPERKDKAPAIIVIHEIFGLTAWEPTVADRFAAKGYVAIVPDLLSSKYGITPPSPDSGRKLIAQLEPERIIADLDAAYAYVDALPAVRKGDVATIGFCWGGARSFLYATANPKLRAAIVCYGSAPDSDRLAGIRASVLGVYGEDDARINADLPRVDSAMTAQGKRFAHAIYPGTGHGFLKPGRRGSDGPSAARAWDDIFAFLERTLGS